MEQKHGSGVYLLGMTHKLRLRYALPLAQMFLGAALLWWSGVWARIVIQRIHGSVGAMPPFVFLTSLNAPVALARAFWFHHVPAPWEDLLFIPAIGFLWLWVALNVESWRSKRMAYMFRWTPLRIASDLLLMGLGVLLGYVCIFYDFGLVAMFNGVPGASIRSCIAYAVHDQGISVVFHAFHIGWAALLVTFFGYDLFTLRILRQQDNESQQ